ncbi:MAG: TlpA disulfide reductase family protein [Candidatus Thiodiazotropha sp. (ex. Lucinoma kazani)]
MKRIVYLIIMLIFLHENAHAGSEYPPAPDFNLQGEDAPVSLSQFKGKVVLLDFWASWCVPCRASFPWMSELQNKYQSLGLEVIAINVDKDPSLAEAFLSKVQAEFTIAFDPKGDVASQYGLKGMPASYLIDKQGRILQSHIGFFQSEKDKRELEIREILKR